MAAGGLDLEFAITLPPGVSEEDLAKRLRSQAGRLNDILAQPILDMHIGAESHRSDPYFNEAPEYGDRLSPPGRGRADRPQATPASRSNAARMDLLNHPTAPIGQPFLSDGAYWQQRQGGRIAERKAAEDKARREREDSTPPPFRARPVPPSVTAPLYSGVQAYSRLRRSRSADPGGPRRGRMVNAGPDGQDPRDFRESSTTPRAKQEVRPSSEERRLPFRATPVPWCVSAPLYDQMLIEDTRSRQERMHSQSRASMRSSSLPPRLEAVRRRMCGDEMDPWSGEGSAVGYRSTTPVPQRHIAKGRAPESRVLNRPLKAELPQGLRQNAGAASGAGAVIDAAENLARDIAAGASKIGWGVSNMHGTSYGISHISRHKTPPQTRAQSAGPRRPYNTTEVPDFVALHEKQRRDRMKYSNRVATQPEPFVFSGPSRSVRMRQPAPAKDPARDPRFHRRPRSARRSHSVPTAAAMFAAGADGGSPSMRGLERSPVTGPPRTTAKTLQAQQHVANRLMQRRVRKVEEEHKIETAKRPDPEIRARVRAAVGPVESIDEVVERQVIEKKQTQRSTMSMKHRDLKEISDKVKRRPLLMQQTDSVARARRLALFQFRGFLKDAGVANPDAHFQDDELDELDRVRADAATFGA